MVTNDCRITLREVADDVGITIGSCHDIFSNVLGMKRVAAKFLLHTSLLVREFLARNNTVTKIKGTLKGRRFTAIDGIKSASLKELQAIPKIEFEKCFKDCKKRWHKCIISNGDYFEGDNIDVDEYTGAPVVGTPILRTHYIVSCDAEVCGAERESSRTIQGRMH